MCRDWSHPESAVLIGDGAAAVVVEATPRGEGSALLAWDMTTWPSGAALAELRGCGTAHHPNDPSTVPEDNLFRMSGMGIYKKAVRKVARYLERLLCATCGSHIASFLRDAMDPAIACHVADFARGRTTELYDEWSQCLRNRGRRFNTPASRYPRRFAGFAFGVAANNRPLG